VQFQCIEPCCNYEHEDNEKRQEALEDEKDKQLLRQLVSMFQNPSKEGIDNETLEKKSDQKAVELLDANTSDIPTISDGKENPGACEVVKRSGACLRDSLWNMYGCGLVFSTSSLVLNPVLNSEDDIQPEDQQSYTYAEGRSQSHSMGLKREYVILAPKDECN
jgi:hypothetical protein